MSEYQFNPIQFQERSDWTCYMFGATESDGIKWNPEKFREPNCFVRFMMRICFDCKWVKKVKND